MQKVVQANRLEEIAVRRGQTGERIQTYIGFDEEILTDLMINSEVFEYSTG
jgi:hypothetical protein